MLRRTLRTHIVLGENSFLIDSSYYYIPTPHGGDDDVRIIYVYESFAVGGDFLRTETNYYIIVVQ